MKILMKLCLVLVALGITTSVASAESIWWDNDGAGGLWITGGNWNEGEFVDVLVPEEVVAAVPGYMDDNGTPEDPGDDFWVAEVPGYTVPEYTIPGYGNDIAPVLGQNVDIRNIAVTTTNVGEAGPINIGINTGHAAAVGDLFIGRSSFSSDAVTVTVDGGTLETSGKIKMGEVAGDVANLNLVSGSITIGGSDHLIVGHGKDDPVDTGKLSAADSGGVATFDMAAGTTLNISQDLEVTYFAGTTGTFTAVGDDNAATIDIIIGDDFRVAGNDHNGGDSVGVFTITDIAMEVGDVLEMGRYGNGTIIANNSSITLVNGGNSIEIGEGGTAPDGTTTGTGLVILNSSSLNATEDMQVGRMGTGTLTLTGSSSVVIDDRMELATDGGTATVNVGGTSTLSVGTGSNDNRRLYLGDNGGTATLNLTGDSVTWVYDDIPVGDDGSIGYLNISDNASLTSDRDDLELGYSGGGYGEMTMTGGTVTIGDDFEMSKSNPGDAGSSLLTMSGGVININDDMKMGQCGGVAVVVMTGGLINVGDSLNMTHLDLGKDMTGTTAHLTLGDGSNPGIVLGDAKIVAGALSMAAVYDATDGSGNSVAVDVWIDFQPGGLLLIDAEARTSHIEDPDGIANSGDEYEVIDEYWTDYIAQLIADGKIFSTYVGDYFGALGAGEYIGVVYDYDVTSAGQTAAYAGVVPEPATMLLLGLGGLLLRRRKR